MVYCRLCDGKWSSRGFFFGPYCPIYGFGAVIVIFLLFPLREHPLIVFLLATFLTTTLEYITSYVMEKLFNAKWWDYSQFKFNINGRVCLLNALEFGFLGLFLCYLIHPRIEKLISYLPNQFIPSICVFILVLLVIDLTATLNSLLNFKEKLKALNEIAEKLKEKQNGKISDLTIYKELSDLRQRFLLKKAGIGKRFLEAFPNLDFKNLNIQLQEFKLDIHHYQKQKEMKKRLKKKEKSEQK